MKNLNDIFSGAVLLCLCAVGAYEVSASIAPSDGEVVGADALPTLALGGMALCGVFLILQGLLRNRPGRSLGNRSAVIKTLLFFGFFVMYLSGMIWLGDRLVAGSRGRTTAGLRSPRSCSCCSPCPFWDAGIPLKS